VVSRDLLATVPGEGREWRLLRLGGRLPITPLQLDRAGPAMGESNEEVFTGLLGLSGQEIRELEADGVFT
jgi:crotonobetainyl-CoA:carnitine CoA-transferase CaiB-like acyl-CoA transferase